MRLLRLLPAKPKLTKRQLEAKRRAARKSAVGSGSDAANAASSSTKSKGPQLSPHVVKEVTQTNKMILALAAMLEETHRKMGVQDQMLKRLGQNLRSSNDRLNNVEKLR